MLRLQPLAWLTTKPGAGLPPHVVVLRSASWKAGGLVARGAQVPPNLHLFPGVLGACLGASPVAHTGGSGPSAEAYGAHGQWA